jgi:hypothetical protein
LCVAGLLVCFRDMSVLIIICACSKCNFANMLISICQASVTNLKACSQNFLLPDGAEQDCMHAYMHAHRHIHTHRWMHAHTHTHTSVVSQLSLLHGVQVPLSCHSDRTVWIGTV